MTYSRSDRFVLLMFLVPAILIIIFSEGYPLLYSLYLSFVDWTLSKSPVPQGFVGFDNFAKVLHDDLFLYSIRNSLKFMVVSTGLTVIGGFLFAILFVGEDKWIKLSRTMMMIPIVVAPVAVGAMWRLMLDTHFGLVNTILKQVGIAPVDWLGNPRIALWSAIWADCWEWTPFVMIIYVASIGSIDPSLRESAMMDGANRWTILKRIIIPLVMPATLLILVFRVIDTFFVIDIIYSLTYGGPGTSTNTASFYIYNQGLKYFNISYAASSSWLLMTFSLLFAGILLHIKKRRERSLG
ncbi:carbohydrate ABC transporter permease [Paenibacillus solisilvae]|uniref:Carbohydrate ABC transporter permease n=1 Tax=Paenibacillus solisilvae TaxID=2486751 RepID=A0ABW0VSD4_9BACL